MELQMFVGATAPGRHRRNRGNPNLTLTIPGGTHGDIATASVVVNCIPAILAAPRACALCAISPYASSRPTPPPSGWLSASRRHGQRVHHRPKS